MALTHVLVFATDYALYRAGLGNGGDVFLRLAQVDDALVFGGQWLRPWTACLVDYGVAQFAVALLALVTVGAETEAWLGTGPFLAVYVCSSTAGVLAVAALDANTSGRGRERRHLGAFGAMAAFSHQRRTGVEPRGSRLGRCRCWRSARRWLIAGLPTLGAEHGEQPRHLWRSPRRRDGVLRRRAAVRVRAGRAGFPARSGTRTRGRWKKTASDGRAGGKKDKTYVGLGVASGLLALESVFVLVQRTLADGP